jgi:hypothetical protein
MGSTIIRRALQDAFGLLHGITLIEMLSSLLEPARVFYGEGLCRCVTIARMGNRAPSKLSALSFPQGVLLRAVRQSIFLGRNVPHDQHRQGRRDRVRGLPARTERQNLKQASSVQPSPESPPQVSAPPPQRESPPRTPRPGKSRFPLVGNKRAAHTLSHACNTAISL